jgi:hypothetical protein
MERQNISKRLRFEVFKRDLFTCQYCGRRAPKVVLFCDHVVPIAKGGQNAITNLTTSCLDCNSGKSAIELSDDALLYLKLQQFAALFFENHLRRRVVGVHEKEAIDLVQRALSIGLTPDNLCEIIYGKKQHVWHQITFSVEKMMQSISSGKTKAELPTVEIVESAIVFEQKVTGLLVSDAFAESIKEARAEREGCSPNELPDPRFH